MNRPRGTPEWKDESMTREKYREMMLTLVIPAIRDKWPRSQWNRTDCIIRIQQDGAKAHLSDDDEEFQNGLRELGLQNKFWLYTQPPNSPDTNVLDLGLFNALQAEYYKTAPSNARELIENVIATYEAYPPHKINRIWLTMMSCFNQILDSCGGNSYKIPHMDKEKLEREGRLPVALNVSQTLELFT